jgi:hypothetical protein
MDEYSKTSLLLEAKMEARNLPSLKCNRDSLKVDGM